MYYYYYLFFTENPLVLYGRYAIYSVLCDWYGSTERMGLFTKTRCLHHPLCNGVSNEPFRVRRTAVSHLTNVDLFGNQGKSNPRFVPSNQGCLHMSSY